MEILRTANAGVLLKLDGVTILLDGVCREVRPYLATPLHRREALRENWPDAVAFTHMHKDHYDPDYAAEFSKCTGGVILGPNQLSGGRATQESMRVGDITVTPVKSRHIGAAGKDTQHYSFLIQGSQCVFFTGDASPSQWRDMKLPKIDVLIAPYAYAITPAGWQAAKALGAERIVLVHMPSRETDPDSLWDMVLGVTGGADGATFYTPAMEEYIEI